MKIKNFNNDSIVKIMWHFYEVFFASMATQLGLDESYFFNVER